MFDPKVIFSDVDGTIVHYAAQLAKSGYELLPQQQPSSSTTSTSEGTAGVGNTNTIICADDTPSPAASPSSPATAPAVSSPQQRPTKIFQWKHIETGIVVDCYEVASFTLGGGFISCKTLHLVQLLRRQLGVQFVIVTGARTATWVGRRGGGTCPRADFDVAEGGGKVWKVQYEDELTNTNGDGGSPPPPSVLELEALRSLDAVEFLHMRETPDFSTATTTLGFACKQVLDEPWLDRLTKEIGPWRDNLQVEDPLERVGPLWDVYRLLQMEIQQNGAKYKLDAKSYVSAFLFDYREMTKLDPTFDATIRKRFKEEISPKYGVSFFTNLGKAHISPTPLNGKRGVVEYIGRDCLKISLERNAVALFDDENDLEFAKVCGLGYLPSVSHPSVLVALAAQDKLEVEASSPASEGTETEGTIPKKWHRVRFDGLLGTEEALTAIIKRKAASLLATQY